MVVGGGYGQIPAILEAKQLNHEVVVVDRNALAPGMSYAHMAFKIDVKDHHSVLKIASKMGIDGIMTMQSDLPVQTVAKVVEALDLHGVSKKTAMACCNKILTRKLLQKHAIPQPRFEVVDTLDSAYIAALEIGLPFIVKPPDSSGSRGVSKVVDMGELLHAYHKGMKYSQYGELLIEEFISGIEKGAQTFSVAGQCIKVLIHNDTLCLPPYMVPTGHSFPATLLPAMKQRIEEICIRTLDALGLQHGPANIDFIVNPKAGPKIIEVGARIGATCLPELVYHHTGVNWVREAVKASLGDDVNLHETTEQPCAATILESPIDGVLKEIFIPDNIYSDPDILDFEVTSNIGDQVLKLTKGTDRIGKLIVAGSSSRSAEMRAEAMKSSILFSIDSDREKIGQTNNLKRELDVL